MPEFNVFRILGDATHATSKLILIWAIHSNRSAEGVSLLTQILYIVVFGTRYLDVFKPHLTDWHSKWNFVLKIAYITTSCYIVFLMMRVFARTREREKAWKLGGYSFIGSAVTAPFIYMIFSKFAKGHGILEILWTFSEELEAFCILPQLVLLRQTTVPTVIDSFYLVTLGSYRALYILNWIMRYAKEGDVNPVSWIFGIIQVAFYVDFAWVYWTRQRVKLRAGGVVDSEDLSRGWLIGKLVGNRKSADFDEDEEAQSDPEAQTGPRRAGRWGARGISISADDGVHDVHKDAERQPLADPDAFEDESDGEAEPATKQQDPVPEVGSGAEWREGDGK
ncbi:hypothetical protein EJ05DRAFT_467669 [Pseudovirgaria hyperparasitica]|uniref:ER lumen protein retaining receptor n=1 Tax=Pseudovirgaria hyperparasitica TaxID=470096 RepID=A0A6A6W028_9PEZI|nr:uncharacterized protein EJ05DRAFT_467669 [Pseudovirgaria hyperparasitica]KAF2755446.1 hypothetical protein EJ05DRAFT_467669 [Pseudovirgaria hyperparasitica]